MEHKGQRGIEVKVEDGDKGTFTARFAQFHVIDHDGDITEPGAFPEGKTVAVSDYGHASWGSAPPVGTAVISTDDKWAYAKGQFFMDVPRARDVFLTVKNMAKAGIGEWSYGFDVIEADRGERDERPVRILKQLDVHEVSPVLLGAGIGTRTTSAKGRTDVSTTDSGTTVKGTMHPLPPHTAAMTTMVWDPVGMRAALKADGATIEGLRSCHALVDASGDPSDVKSYDYPHHHGTDGPVNIRACIEGIARLNGAGGKCALGAAARKGVYDHLARHLMEADREVPPLRDADGELKLHEEGIALVGTVREFLVKVAEVGTRRAEKGRALSDVNVDAVDWLGEDLKALVREHQALMHVLREQPTEALGAEFARFIETVHRIDV